MVENIEIYHGDTFLKTFQLLEEDEVTPISLTGATVRFAIGTTINETTSGVTITQTDATGTIDVQVSYALMEALTDLEYPIALELNWSDGVRDTVFAGILSILEDVR